MAYQTPYADIPLNTRAIANYNNPIFDVLRNGLGWLENQEQKIADRKKFELLKQIQDDAMTDKYTQAKNANEDLAKQLYGNSYFVDSSDADLAKAIEALKVRESNRMLDTVGRDIVSKVNQDVYKAGNEQDLLSSLGFNNRTTKELNDIRDFAQKQLEGRYKPYIQGKLADREVEEGKVSEQDIDALVNEFKDKYGMDINPADLYDATKRKDYRQASVNSRIAQAHKQILNKTASPEDIINYMYMLQGVNPESSVDISNAITNFTNIKTNKYKQSAASMLKDAYDYEASQTRDGSSVDLDNVRAIFTNSATTAGIPMDVIENTFNTYVDPKYNYESERLTRAASRAELAYEEYKKSKPYKMFEQSLESLNKDLANVDTNKLTAPLNDALRESGIESLSENDLLDILAYIRMRGITITNVDDYGAWKNTFKKYLSSTNDFLNKAKKLKNDAEYFRLLANSSPSRGVFFNGYRN